MNFRNALAPPRCRHCTKIVTIEGKRKRCKNPASLVLPNKNRCAIHQPPEPAERFYCSAEVTDRYGVLTNCKNVAKAGSDFCHIHAQKRRQA